MGNLGQEINQGFLVDVNKLESFNKDKKCRYTFDKSFNISLEIALEMIGKKVIPKDQAKWLEPYYEIKQDDEKILIIDVTEPYCG